VVVLDLAEILQLAGLRLLDLDALQEEVELPACEPVDFRPLHAHEPSVILFQSMVSISVAFA
jgi:hypothetical protein